MSTCWEMSYWRGDCADRLYAPAKSVSERVALQRWHEESLSRTLSSQLTEVTRRIAAEMPGREGPISDRLYAEVRHTHKLGHPNMAILANHLPRLLLFWGFPL